MRVVIVALVVAFIALFCTFGLPLLFERWVVPRTSSNADVLKFLYFLCFLLLSMNAASLLSFLLLTVFERVYVIVMAAAVQYLLIETTASFVGMPAVSFVSDGVNAMRLAVTFSEKAANPQLIWVWLVVPGYATFGVVSHRVAQLFETLAKMNRGV